MHIGIAEDDPSQAAQLALWLAQSGHSAVGFGTAGECLDALRQQRFDLLLVDWSLPDGTGGDLLRWVRGHLGWEMPMMVVTAREDEDTIVDALTAGADDYLVKPPKQRELLARVEALGRRAKGAPVAASLRLGPIDVDIRQQRVTVDGKAVLLTQKEFDLLSYLVHHPGKLFSREHLLDRVWGISAAVDTRTVNTHISRLRKKIGLDGSLGWRLTPVYGLGYRLEESAEGALP